MRPVKIATLIKTEAYVFRQTRDTDDCKMRLKGLL